MRQKDGFTLIELIVVTALTAILSAVILQFSLSYMRFSSIVQSDSSAFVERLNASDYLRENLGLSSGLIAQNSINDNNTLVTDSDPQHWQVLYPISNTTYGTTSSVTPLLYFKKYSKDSSGTLISSGTSYYEDEYVLYHDGSSQQLRVRTLANPDAAGNVRLTTCPVANASATCPADLVLMDNITSVKLRYFSRAGIELSVTSSGTDALGNTVTPCTNTVYPYTGCIGANFNIVEVVEITLNLQTQPLGTHSVTTKSATVIRIALRNT
jgi:prepilin-type N-terminal cleavage/methylation domain-containing protein